MGINLIPENKIAYEVKPVCPPAEVENSLRGNSQDQNGSKQRNPNHYRRIPVIDYDTAEINGFAVQVRLARQVPKEGGSLDTLA